MKTTPIFVAAALTVGAMSFWTTVCVVNYRDIEKYTASQLAEKQDGLAFRAEPLNHDLKTWETLEWEEKVTALKYAIDWLRQTKNAAIIKSPEFYARRMDETLRERPEFKLTPLPKALLFLAVAEYDYYAGMDRDQLARQLLGPDYEANRRRLGLPVETASQPS
jgi:hypothetical protein